MLACFACISLFLCHYIQRWHLINSSWEILLFILALTTSFVEQKQCLDITSLFPDSTIHYIIGKYTHIKGDVKSFFSKKYGLLFDYFVNRMTFFSDQLLFYVSISNELYFYLSFKFFNKKEKLLSYHMAMELTKTFHFLVL